MSSADWSATAERVRFGRAYAVEQLPWFAPALFRCRIVVSEEVRVAAVDRYYNVYWNPDAVSAIYAGRDRKRALSELAFLWVHEVSHRLRRHAERAGERGVSSEVEARRWNVACDLEVNDSRWRGLQMPENFPGQRADNYGLPDGELAETYYGRLGEIGEYPDEGSGIHGQPRPWERGQPRKISPLEEEILRREVARLTREAAEDRIPDSWKSWAADVLGSRVNWRQRLGHRLSIALQRGRGMRTDYQRGRPSRRQSVYYPVMPPSLSGAATTRLAIVIDTSASMTPPDLQRALAEVAAVVRQLGAPVTLIPCDLHAYEPVRVIGEREAFSINQLPGGSGTDMRAGLDAALDLRPLPDAVLVLTDGHTEYPDRPYALPLLFGILGEEARQEPPQPPFRSDQVIRIR